MHNLCVKIIMCTYIVYDTCEENMTSTTYMLPVKTY